MDYEYMYQYLKSQTDCQKCLACGLETKKDPVGAKILDHLQLQSDLGSEVKCKDKYDLEKLEEEIKELKTEKRTIKFKKDGWNKPGVNMLITACQVADKEELCVRKKFGKLEIAVVVMGLASAAANCKIGSYWIWFFVAIWLLSVMWRLGRTIPAAHIIQKLGQEQQQKLVDKLLDLCLENNIDPDKQIDIINNSSPTNMTFNNNIIEIVVIFLEDAVY